MPRATLATSLARMVHISRPVLWINTLGTGTIAMWLTGDLWRSDALVPLLWLTLPFNLLIYGVNDIFDQDTDALSARKGTLQGARITSLEAPRILTAVILGNLPFMAYFLVVLPWPALAWLSVYSLVFVFYSAPPLRFKARPYLDSLSNSAYALPLVFVPLALDAAPVWPAVLGLMAWSAAKHTFDAVQDIDDDRAVGITTTANRLGARGVIAWSGAWWVIASTFFALVNVPVALLNALIGGWLLVSLWRAPSPEIGHRLYPYSIAFPYVGGALAGVQLVGAIVVGWYP